MFDSVIGMIVILGVVVVLTRQHARIGLLEQQVSALRRLGQQVPKVDAMAEAAAAVPAPPPRADKEIGTLLDAAPAAARPEPAPQSSDEQAAAAEAGPWAKAAREQALEQRQEQKPESAPEPAPELAPQRDLQPSLQGPAAGSAAKGPRKDLETALGTRWAVWVGGIALALGGLFLIRYSIEAGFFGPAIRLTMAGLLGLALVAGGEFIRRTGFKVPVEGMAGAYVPGILTAAGAFTLFGTIYAAHALYGFLGPASAFVLLGLVGVGAIVAALVHGQALAGLGLLGATATPMLVASNAPNPWALFGYLAIVLVAATAIARLRDWRALMAAAFFGTGLWSVLYLAAPPVDMAVVAFINLVIVAALAFLWLSGRGVQREQAGRHDWPTIVPAFFVAAAAVALMANPDHQPAGGRPVGALLLVALLATALYRPRATAMLHAAGIALLAVFWRLGFSGTFLVDFGGERLTLSGFDLLPEAASLRTFGFVLGPLFLAAGAWNARRLAAPEPLLAAAWSAWASLAPLWVLAACWIAFGDPDRDLAYAALAMALTVVLTVSAEWISRAETPPLRGGEAVSAALAGAGAAAALMLHMAFGPGLTTVFVGAAAIVPALATRLRGWPALGWLSAGAAILSILRVAMDPTIVGPEFLQTTPVFNWLLPGYGVPALAFGLAAWQLARSTGGRPRLVMEAAAALFSLLAVAMLVRHAMHGGVIASGPVSLAEQAIYTLLALGAGAILVALDTRSPSPVLRIGSMAAGVASTIFVVGQHFVVLNPLFTDESTGRIPVFDLLFLAYLLPAAAAAGLALYARGKRPTWYAQMLALLAAALAFAYATLSLRRLFQGEFIAIWAGMSQLETYAYSALWLSLGVLLLVAGIRLKSQVLRVASGVLIATAVAKVFLFDMSELEGVLRALSFIGLGAVLIGIGLFYQKLLAREARAVQG